MIDPAADQPVLITGGAGFIGSNIADRLAVEGHDVIVYDSLARAGTRANLLWLQQRHPTRVKSVLADIRDTEQLTKYAARAKAVFHMAAQVAVTTSITDPREDFDVNIGGTITLLEALRLHNPEAPLVFASTNKVYGDLADIAMEDSENGYQPADAGIRGHGVGEDRPLDFHTPYGCSKGAADQYVLDYARSFDLPTAVLRMSCIYGQRQMGNEDQGWVAHFLISALENRPITLFGDGRQVRDILDVSNAVDAYLSAWRRMDSVKGRAFNLGGGPDNAVSLITLIDHIGTLLQRDPIVRFSDWRQGDQRYFVADTRAADDALHLKPKLPWRDGVAQLARWLAENRGTRPPLAPQQQPVEPVIMRAVP